MKRPDVSADDVLSAVFGIHLLDPAGDVPQVLDGMVDHKLVGVGPVERVELLATNQFAHI